MAYKKGKIKDSGNRFLALSKNRNEDRLDSETVVSTPTRKVINGVIGEARQVFNKLQAMLADGSLDEVSRKHISSEADSLTEEVSRFRSLPQRFSSSKMAALIERLQRLKGFFPIKMVSAEDGAEVRAFGKETKNGLRKEDVESGLTVFPKQDPLPDKGHSGDDWTKKPKESLAQDDEGKANEEVRAEAEAALPPLQIQVSSDMINFESVSQEVVSSGYAKDMDVGIEEGLRPPRSQLPKVARSDGDDDARKVFEEMPEQILVGKSHMGSGTRSCFNNLVSNVAISGAIKSKISETNNGNLSSAHQVFGEMPIPGVKCEAAQAISDSAKVEVRIDAQSHDADGAQEVFDKRSQQVSTATSRGGRKNLDEKGGGSILPYAQSKRVAHAPSVFEPNHGLNWARAVTEGSKPKSNAPRLNVRSGSKLEYIAPILPGIIDIEDDLIDDHTWETCLVGFFLEDSLAFGLVRAIAMTLWGSEGLIEVSGNDSGFFFFKFESTQHMDNILEKGPWHFSGKLLILKRWRKCMRLAKEGVSKIPVWVKFYDLPLEFWNDKCLSRIASAIGTPLFMDKATDTKQRISFARVCIEVEASKPLLSSVCIRCGGEDIEILVEYQGLPPMCDRCSLFGHDPAKCREFKRDREAMNCQEGGSGKVTEQESNSDSSSSSEWIKVKKKRNTSKKMRSDIGVQPAAQPRGKYVSQPASPPRRSLDPHCGLAIDQPRRSSPVIDHPRRSPDYGDTAWSSVPPLSPAILASLRSHAVEGAGKLGNRR